MDGRRDGLCQEHFGLARASVSVTYMTTDMQTDIRTDISLKNNFLLHYIDFRFAMVCEFGGLASVWFYTLSKSGKPHRFSRFHTLSEFCVVFIR